MSTFQSESCLGFFEHWRALRTDGEHIPRYSDFLDHPHPKYAPHLHITDVSGTDMIIRLMGTELVVGWGQDKTGEILGHDQPSAIRKALFTNSYSAISTPCGVHGLVKFEANKGSRIEVEAVAFPLYVEPGKANRLVSFSQTLRTLSYGEIPTNYVSFPGTEWIDIGAGVPDHAPAVIDE